MARPKTALNKAAEQFTCPTCAQTKANACINTETGQVVTTHKRRQDLVCQETFLQFPPVMISGGKEWTMFCARHVNHRANQHTTLDKRLSWSRDFGVAEGRALYDELMAEVS